MKFFNAIIFSIILCTNYVHAQNQDEWQYELTPYLLAAGIEGTVGIRDHEADMDVSFSDIWDDLDSGFMGLFTAHKGPWMFALEGVYMKLEGDNDGAITGPHGMVSVNGNLEITNTMYIAQGTIGYRILDGNTKVNAIGAVRYNKLEVDIDVKVNFNPPIFNNSSSEDDSKNWTDAVVGLQVLHPISKTTELIGYADVGAGGSDLTYQFMGGVNWEFTEGFRAKLGYRYLYWDYEDDGFKWDVDASGPYLGLGIRF